MNDGSSQQPTGGFDPTEQALPWQDMIASVFRHRRIILAVLVTGIVLSTLRAWFLPPTYKASTLLMVKDNRATIAVSPDAGTGARMDRTGDYQINSLAALIRSPALIRTVLEPKDAKVAEATPAEVQEESWLVNPVKLPGILYRKLHGIPAPSTIEQQATAISNRIQVSPVRRSNLIEVSFVSGSPRWAASFLNRLAEKLIKKYTDLYDASGAQQFFHSQRNLLGDQLQEAQSALAAFRERVGTELLTLNSDQLRARVGELEHGLANMRTEVAEIEARAAAPADMIFTEAAGSDPESGIVGNQTVNSLKGRIVNLELSRSELLSRYTASSTAVRDIDRQIVEAKRILAKERTATIELYRDAALAKANALTARINAVSQQLADYREKLKQLNAVEPEWEQLQNEVSTRRAAYLTYLRKEEEARFSNALDDSQIVNVTVAEPAKVPREPQSSEMLKLILVGAGLSLIAGIAMALLWDWLDPSVKTTRQAQRITGLPVLGEIQA